MKCQKCTKAATLHITEIVSEDQVEELHLCEECAHKYLYEPQHKQQTGIKQAQAAGPVEETEEPAVLNRECEVCGLKFVDFRNTGRLGCPHDYDEFGEELTQLLESVHGETRHVGKVPRRQPEARKAQEELTQLRRKLTS